MGEGAYREDGDGSKHGRVNDFTGGSEEDDEGETTTYEAGSVLSEDLGEELDENAKRKVFIKKRRQELGGDLPLHTNDAREHAPNIDQDELA